MLNNLEHRFPISDDTILASLLDPRFQNLLDVQIYLKSVGYTAVEFIVKYSKDIIKENLVTSIVNDVLPKKSYINEMVEKHSTLAWKENSKMMPLLSEVAVAIYGTPATSTPSERNFNTNGAPPPVSSLLASRRRYFSIGAHL